MFRLSFYLSYFFLCACLFLATACHSQTTLARESENQIHFIENSWPEAIKQAKAQHKYIFMDTYATWCGPCNLMKAVTFRNKKVADFYNEHFVNLSINIERGIGPELATCLGIQSIPTLIVFDENGKPVSGAMGYMGASKLIQFGQQALNKQTL